MYNWTILEALRQERERKIKQTLKDDEWNPLPEQPAARPSLRLDALLAFGLARLLLRWLMQRQ